MRDPDTNMTKEAKEGTAGPWQVGGMNNATVQAANCEQIAVCGGKHRSAAEKAANAALIVSAVNAYLANEGAGGARKAAELIVGDQGEQAIEDAAAIIERHTQPPSIPSGKSTTSSPEQGAAHRSERALEEDWRMVRLWMDCVRVKYPELTTRGHEALNRLERALKQSAPMGDREALEEAIREFSPIIGYCRAEVLSFAVLMEHELRNNDTKGGWRGMLPNDLAKRVRGEATELLAVARVNGDKKKIAEEAADVANMAMMVADVAGCLPMRNALTAKSVLNALKHSPAPVAAKEGK